MGSLHPFSPRPRSSGRPFGLRVPLPGRPQIRKPYHKLPMEDAFLPMAAGGPGATVILELSTIQRGAFKLVAGCLRYLVRG